MDECTLNNVTRSSELQRGDFLLSPRSTSATVVSLQAVPFSSMDLFRKVRTGGLLDKGKLNPEEEPIEAWHLLWGPWISWHCPQWPVPRKCKSSAAHIWSGSADPPMSWAEGQDSQLEQCCFRGRQKLWKSGGNSKRTKEMYKLYHLLTLLTQPLVLARGML